MAYKFEDLKLEKGMYAHSGKSFTKVLESLDPSENYRGTPLEGLDFELIKKEPLLHAFSAENRRKKLGGVV